MSAHDSMARTMTFYSTRTQYVSPEFYDTRETPDSALYGAVKQEHDQCPTEEYQGGGGDPILFCHEHRLAVRHRVPARRR